MRATTLNCLVAMIVLVSIFFVEMPTIEAYIIMPIKYLVYHIDVIDNVKEQIEFSTIEVSP